MDDRLIFNSPEYWLMFALLVFSRGMDFLSTRVATPNLALEGNPIAKWMGWRLGGFVNFGLCAGFAFWPVTAIIISTTSLLVAARNFQQAWLMRTLGEDGYSVWFVQRIYEASLPFYFFCLLCQTGLIALVGFSLVYFSSDQEQVWVIPFAIGIGIVGYAATVLFYTTLAVWRIRRAMAPKLPNNYRSHLSDSET